MMDINLSMSIFPVLVFYMVKHMALAMSSDVG